MADDNGKKPDLLVPDHSIVSIEQAKQEAQRKKGGKGGGTASNFVSQQQLLDILDGIQAGIAQGVLAVGEKMYEQASGELAENFEDLERRMVALVHRELEARSLRGRARAWWRRVAGHPAPALVVDAVEALDPNIAAAASDSGEVTRTINGQEHRFTNARAADQFEAALAADVLHTHAP